MVRPIGTILLGYRIHKDKFIHKLLSSIDHQHKADTQVFSHPDKLSQNRARYASHGEWWLTTHY